MENEIKPEKERYLLKSFSLTNLSITNVKTVLLVTVLIAFAGLSAYMSMPKEAFPELNIPEIYVGVAYPGASPKVIEEKITKKIEKEIRSVRGVDKIKSTSLFGYATVVVTFTFDNTPQEALRKVKDAVDKARGDVNFPKDLPAEPNIFEMNFSEFPIMNINLSSEKFKQDELIEYAEYLEEEIEKIDEISKVEIRGVQKKEVKVEVRKNDLEARKVSFGDIEQAIRSENTIVSAGEIKDNGIARSVYVDGEFKTLDDLKDLVIKRDYFEIVYLKDVADVSFGAEDTTSYARQNMQPVVMLDVIKRSGTNLLIASAQIDDVLKEAYEKGRIPKEVKYTITNDMSFKTEDQVANLENNIISGVILVVLILQLFLGFRSALFVGIAIPMSMFMSFLILDSMGVTLNIMVLFSLVLALGMLVDNGIVVVENIYRQINDGMSMFDAVKYGVGEIAWPIISSTATTVAAFIPLALWPGLMGEFMQYLPLTLMIVLSSSLFVALVINPVLALVYMKLKEEKQTSKKVWGRALIFIGASIVFFVWSFVSEGSFTIANLTLTVAVIMLSNHYILNPGTDYFQITLLPNTENFYRRFLKNALSRPKTVFFGTFGLLFVSFIMVGMFTPKILFFPENEPGYVNVFIELPVGTDISKTNEIAEKAEKIIDSALADEKKIVFMNDKDTIPFINSMITQVGEGTSDPMAGPQMGNTPHKARITVAFAEAPFRMGNKTSDVMKKIRASLQNQFDADVKISVDKDPAGPPQEPPINIELYGDDYDSLIVEAENMLAFLQSKNVPGVEQLKLDVETGKPELPIYTDRGLSRRMDLSTGQIGMALRTALFGTDVTTFKIADENYDINLKYKENLRKDMEALLDQKITFRDMLSGQLVQVPVRTVIEKPVRTTTYSAIKHKHTDRVVTIYSNVSEGANPTEVVEALKKEMKNYKTGNNVAWKFTGQMEEQAKEMGFLSKALLIAVFLVFLIIVTQFNSISSPAIIMTSVLLSLIGVFLGLVIFQMEFVIIMTMIGIISLAGVVVNNAIVLVDFVILLIQRKREELKLKEEDSLPVSEIINCIADAGAMRLRPVLLTAITTLLGLIPLAMGININFITLYSDFDPQFFIGGDNVMFFGPLSWTVIFGLSFATFLTLVVVPVTFLLIYNLKKKIYNRTQWKLLKSY
ncbi:MAG: efflux RND transporter permease subunit [Bacteroidota bacterium]